MITSITPNFDAFIFVEKEDEHRNVQRFPVILWAATVDPRDPASAGIMPVSLMPNGKLLMGAERVVRDEPKEDNV